MRGAALVAALSFQSFLTAAAPPGSASKVIELPAGAEVVATIGARCEACAWEIEGREAVMLSIELDGRYVAHVPLVRQGRADYPVLLGRVAPGRHTIRAQADRASTAKDLRSGSAVIEDIAVTPVREHDREHTALSLSPILYARPNTVGRFTDVPVLMYYEREPTTGGTRYRYTVIFSNEDGGTPADRLMATWGRTTDIEYVYSVEVDAAGKIAADDFQGPEHAILPFRGTREGRHPLLWVSTDNNMVRDTGTTRVRYAPAPIAFALDGVSREAVMDAHPWLYKLSAQELAREGKIVEDGPAGRGTVPDPRRFIYVEACGEVGNAALAFEVGVAGTWIPSDRGVPEYRIVRNGCFRGAAPVPAGTAPTDLRALRVIAHARPPRGGGPEERPTPDRQLPRLRLERINRVFMLNDRYEPGPSLLEWSGPAEITAAAPLEIPLR